MPEKVTLKEFADKFREANPSLSDLSDTDVVKAAEKEFPGVKNNIDLSGIEKTREFLLKGSREGTFEFPGWLNNTALGLSLVDPAIGLAKAAPRLIRAGSKFIPAFARAAAPQAAEGAKSIVGGGALTAAGTALQHAGVPHAGYAAYPGIGMMLSGGKNLAKGVGEGIEAGKLALKDIPESPVKSSESFKSKSARLGRLSGFMKGESGQYSPKFDLENEYTPKVKGSESFLRKETSGLQKEPFDAKKYISDQRDMKATRVANHIKSMPNFKDIDPKAFDNLTKDHWKTIFSEAKLPVPRDINNLDSNGISETIEAVKRKLLPNVPLE